jgi:flavin-dependent dehydrogenase
MHEVDALVVGGGPAGATAAALLARAGWRVLLVEKQRFPRRKVCGEFISETSWPLLQELGLGSCLRARAGPRVRRVAVFVGEREVAATVASNAANPGGRAIGRDLLDTALLDQAQALGASVLQRWTLAGFEDDGDHYTCRLKRLRGDETLACRARLIIAAHGSWQPGVLPTQRFPRAAQDADLFGFKAHFGASALSPDLMPLFAFPGGYGGMVHSDGGRLSISCCVRRDRLQRCRNEFPALPAGEAVQAHIERHCAGVRRALAQAPRLGGWLAAGPLRTGIRGFGDGGVFAVGNAAAEAHPIIAEGISMAIQGAGMLCVRLLVADARHVDRGELASLRQAYEADWRRQFSTRLHFSAALAHLFMAPGTARMASAVVDRAPALLTLGSRWSGKARALPLAPPAPH